MINAHHHAADRRAARSIQRGSASVEYTIVTIMVVLALVTSVKNTNPLVLLCQAIIGFYADFSSAISLATP